jgi:uncharacterized protein YnzC (UPF0291/DUF896 family)
MVCTSTTTKNEADILQRLLNQNAPGFTPDAARFFLSLTFASDDVDRMNELSSKAGEGTLTEEEQQELDSYEGIGHLLGMLKSKARKLLAATTGSDES